MMKSSADEPFFDDNPSETFRSRQQRNSVIRTIRHQGTSVVVDPTEEIGISIALTASYSLTYRVGGRSVNIAPRIGRFGLLTPGHAVGIDIVGDCAALQLAMPISLARRWWEEDHGVDAARVELHPKHSIEDPVITHLICRARVEGIASEEEMLCQVAGRLLQRHAGREERAKVPARGGLTPSQLRRVRDRVEDDLRGTLTLQVLAAEARLSPFHFIREFKRATGRSPYQYVIDRRVARAVAALADGALSAENIAWSTGFGSASHLARYVRRALGCSPAELRRSVLL